MSEDELEEINNLDTKTLVVMIYKELQEVKLAYVRKEEFSPVKRCCYALMGSGFVVTISGIVTILVG